MPLSRNTFKHATRKCKKDKETINAHSIAEKMCKNDSHKFRKNVKHLVKSKTKIFINIDGVHGDENIGSMWKHHYENVFNIVKDSRCYKGYIQNNTGLSHDTTHNCYALLNFMKNNNHTIMV